MLSVCEGAQKALRQVAIYKKDYGFCFKVNDNYLRNMVGSAYSTLHDRPWGKVCCKSPNCLSFGSCTACWKNLMETDKNDD